MRVAAVDVGTNTTRLLLAKVPSGAMPRGARLEWEDRRVTITRLGQGVDVTGRLDDEAIGRTIAVLAGYGTVIRGADVEAVRAVATSAVRDAENRAELLDRAEIALGVRPEVISGAEEAELAFGGATTGVTAELPAIVIDLGGGSTEFVMGSGAVEYARSVDIGSVRLTERRLLRQPAQPEDVDVARHHVDEALSSLHLPGPYATAIGVGGTLTALAAVVLQLPAYDPRLVHGTILGASDLSELIERLAPMTVASIAQIPSLDPARAPVILGGAIVAERALRVIGASQVTVSESDLLDGVALSLAR